LLPFSRLII